MIQASAQTVGWALGGKSPKPCTLNPKAHRNVVSPLAISGQKRDAEALGFRECWSFKGHKPAGNWEMVA